MFGGKVKKFLAILVLGLLLSSNAYTASVDDCDGTKSNSTTVKYECVNGDTMTVAAGTLIKKKLGSGYSAKIQCSRGNDQQQWNN